MGILLLEEFRTQLVFLLENRTDVPVDTLNLWINTIYEHVCFPSVHRQWELETTVVVPLVANTFEYTLAASAAYVDQELLGVRGARYVVGTSDSYTFTRRRMTPSNIGWFNSRTHTVTASGPNTYTIARKRLLVSPGPDSTIAGNVVVLEAWQQPTRLTEGQSTVLIPYWDQVILMGAKWMAESMLGLGEKSQLSRVDYAAAINEAPVRDTTGADDEQGWFPDLDQGNMSVMPRGKM